jgi:phosphatidylserine/phosphatidylglycerophosphate/cardiolipin synthase-like enzyme
MVSTGVWAGTLALLVVAAGAAYFVGLQGGTPRMTTSTQVNTWTTTQTLTSTLSWTTFTTTAVQTLVMTETVLVNQITTSTITATTTRQPQDLVVYCFSPGGDCDQVLIGQIDSAKTKIHVLIYSFTLDNVRDALIAAHNRGVDVKVVMEQQNVNAAGSEYYALKNAGVSVRWDSNSALMHDKFTVIDGHIIMTGSYNWTQSSTDSNNENLAVIDSTSWASAYETVFQAVYSSSVAG